MKSIINRFKVNLLSCVVVAVLIPLILTTGVAQAASWSVVPSPNPGVSGNELNAVAVVASNNVWTVGDITVGNGARQTLTEHWDGTSWSVISSPSPSPFVNVLSGATAVSANDVWAVGSFANAHDIPRTLTERWNGGAWGVVPSPNASTTSTNVLNAVQAASANDVWAVGQFSAVSGFRQTLTEHWNGKKWSVVSSPNVGTHDNILHGVTTVSADDVWAVGDFLDSNSNAHTLIEHWNGTTWSVVPHPRPGSGASTLNDVKAVSANDVWAVGFALNNGPAQTLIEHWNGTTWSVVPSPNPSSTLNFLNGVAADPHSRQTWAVGVFFDASGAEMTLTEFHP